MIYSLDGLRGFRKGQRVESRCGYKLGTVTGISDRLGVIVHWDDHTVPYGVKPEVLKPLEAGRICPRN